MSKKVIRITEGDLNKIINESVKKILNEESLGFDDRVLDLLKRGKECLGADQLCDRLASRLAGQIGQQGLFETLKDIISIDCYGMFDDEE